jgi:hypothetical protein
MGIMKHIDTLKSSRKMTFVNVCLIRIIYIINVTVVESMLTVEIENEGTSERWTGEYTSQCDFAPLLLFLLNVNSFPLSMLNRCRRNHAQGGKFQKVFGFCKNALLRIQQRD